MTKTTLENNIKKACKAKNVTPIAIIVHSESSASILLETELDMYRMWENYINDPHQKGYLEQIKTYFVHVVLGAQS